MNTQPGYRRIATRHRFGRVHLMPPRRPPPIPVWQAWIMATIMVAWVSLCLWLWWRLLS